MIEILIPNWVVPSQNVRDRRHWRVNQKEKKWLQSLIYAHMEPRNVCEIGRFRYVEIMCWRKQRITDDANYRGGAKGLVDCLTSEGAIWDDSDKHVLITYRQDVRSKCPNKGKELTRVRVSDSPFDL